MHLDSWTEIETYKDLNLAALRQGYSTCLYIYYLLRAYDGQGKGYVDYDKFVQFLKHEGIKREQIYTALKNPQHTTFFVCKKTIVKGKMIKVLEYRSLEKISAYLNTCPGLSVYISIPNIRNIKNFNAYIYSTLFRTKKSLEQVSMSRDKIKELTGLSVPTQITYEKITGMTVTPTLACYVIPENMNHIPMTEIIESLPCKDMHHTIKGRRVSWQRANKYYSPDVRVYKGRTHRVNRLMKKSGEGLMPNSMGKRATSPKLYHHDVTTTMFTDQRPSYIHAFFTVPTQYGKQANVYRYNFLSPTTNPAEAVPGAYLNENKFIVIREPVQSTRIQEEILVG